MYRNIYINMKHELHENYPCQFQAQMITVANTNKFHSFLERRVRDIPADLHRKYFVTLVEYSV